MAPRGGRGGGGGGGNRAPLPRDVQVSKKISWLLRHGAEKEGLQLDSHGFLNVQVVLSNRNIRSLKVTFDELREIVEGNDKQRFTMVPVTSSTPGQPDKHPESSSTEIQQQPVQSNRPEDYLIRANQGHSLKLSDDSGLLTPITAANLPAAAVHGTTHAAWPLIVASGGLKAMGRNHVHFASGLPSGFKSLADSESDGAAATTTVTVDAPVISGMRNSSTILMFLDLDKALAAGVKLGVSDNGVILSEGNADGLVPLEVLKRVEDRTGEGVLLLDGRVVKESPAGWAGKGKGRGKG
ncbi:tRNA 2'-phosphotransferase [Friedmanniomyces endolithicus]|uniref:2'-phosphotransferase n=1 Tax=Friedmanniomyces endolithicus TaxID=329885 RepID=A0AAN6QPP7_9PEZI|nr:tRNA 2'-phosphotransferase [Friedmanniomyces endolithicus]KAK0789809.1 tRNA 2'-phosphotransferase [Friedmanniomyces endolithicus]KAK0807883.1 tRNA 2'-phosphotransferase [Friedmanniomyces endolithicus]KAK0843871.1 tRNA 2'-phosphotransferase [Friedmanniomyces endolithicus]KAK0857760.1 tRNA 2'-phosphotransferase [Friedmanniomyces endolithicus]